MPTKPFWFGWHPFYNVRNSAAHLARQNSYSERSLNDILGAAPGTKLANYLELSSRFEKKTKMIPAIPN